MKTKALTCNVAQVSQDKLNGRVSERVSELPRVEDAFPQIKHLRGLRGRKLIKALERLQYEFIAAYRGDSG
jgi:hypothetical protein